jgi:hypothetical protein
MLRSSAAAIVFALGAAGCGAATAVAASPQPVVTSAAARAETPRKELARELVGLLAAGRYEQARAAFDDKIAATLSASRLEGGFTDSRGDSGRFVAVSELHETSTGRRSIVWATAEFEKGSIVVTVGFDDAARVSSLWFGPLTPTWRAPAYCDLSAIEERDLEVGVRPKLAATLTRPKAGARFPVAILVHGSGPNDRDESNKGTKLFKDLACGLASRGVAVLRYEKRSHELPKTVPKAVTYDTETVLDARAAVVDAKALPDVDGAKVFVVGHSLGAALAPKIAKGAEGLAGIALLAGPTRRIDKLLADQTAYLMRLHHANQHAIELAIAAERDAFDAAERPGPPDETFVLMGAKRPRSYIVDQLAYDPRPIALELTTPIFVLQGDRDYQVTAADDFVGWQRALAGRPNVTMRLYKGLNHHFVFGTAPSVPDEYDAPAHADVKVIEDLAAWIRAGSLPPS